MWCYCLYVQQLGLNPSVMSVRLTSVAVAQGRDKFTVSVYELTNIYSIHVISSIILYARYCGLITLYF